jgi:hypothetical protein
MELTVLGSQYIILGWDCSYDSQWLRWKYSNLPPHGVRDISQGQGYITTNSQSVCLGVEPNLGHTDC